MNKDLKDSYVSRNCKGDTVVHLGYDKFGKEYFLMSPDIILTDQQISFTVKYNTINKRIGVQLDKLTSLPDSAIQMLYEGKLELSVKKEDEVMCLGIFKLAETKKYIISKNLNHLRCEFIPTQACGTGVIDFISHIESEL